MKQKLNEAMSDEPKTDAKMLICDNTLFMAIVLCSAFISSCPRDSSEICLLGKLFEHHAQNLIH